MLKCKFICLDATVPMLRIGQQEADKEHLSNMVFVKGYAEELPFLDNSFDIVFSRLAFHHFTDVTAVFSEMVTKGAIIHHSKVGALRSPKAPRRRAVIFRSHGLLQIKQGTLRFPCAGCHQLPFCGLAIWGHLALQAVPSRQVS